MSASERGGKSATGARRRGRSARRRAVNAALDALCAAIADPKLAQDIKKARRTRGRPGDALARAAGLARLAEALEALLEADAAVGDSPATLAPLKDAPAPCAPMPQAIPAPSLAHGDPAERQSPPGCAADWVGRLRAARSGEDSREAIMGELTSRVRGLYKDEVVAIAEDLTGARYRTKRDALEAIERWLETREAA